MAEKVSKSEQQWRSELDDQQFMVCRKGSEAPSSGEYWDSKDAIAHDNCLFPEKY